MIFQNDLKVTKITIEIKEEKRQIAYNFVLSDGRTWTYLTDPQDPIVFFNRAELELAVIHFLAEAMLQLKKEVDGNSTRENVG